jgi:hypothetical protein
VTPGEVILAVLGFVGTVLGIVAVFRRGREDSIDRKRESEIERLDGDLKELRKEVDGWRLDSRLVAGVAVRAIRAIQALPGAPAFSLSNEERDALERTRPVI